VAVILCWTVSAFAGSVGSIMAGDILRGGAIRASDAARVRNLSTIGQAKALKLRANTQDRLARTTRALQQMQAAQGAARSAATTANHLGMNPLTGAPLPDVPDGLGLGALDLDRVVYGANNPLQSGNNVTVKQNDSQALLHWKTFNVGRNTTLNFDQSAGGADAGKWIALNKVTGADAAPSQILGSINAQGQVYVLNQNGIIFGGASQINTRTLVASSLPINDNLVRQGLLNNRDSQFIFSTIEVPGGADGTPPFVPPAPPPGGRYGDVTVQRGAQIRTSVSPEGGGGRVMLVGPNVNNEGTIETPAGQTILAAGNQVGVAPHSSDDLSLRGLDVWVGRVETGAGSVVNSGIIRSLTGSITMAGKRVTQAGALESSTSVALNGRIDLLASYGAVANPNFDNSGTPGFLAPVFFNQFTGVAKFLPGSVTRIIPQVDGKRIPGTSLPERSQVNLEGLAVHFGPGSILMAPSGAVNIRAGTWPYRDLGDNGTIFDAGGAAEVGLDKYYEGGRQKFFHDRGQVYFDRGSLIDVSGSTTAFVPLSQSVVEVTLRGNELADSPLLRKSSIRGIDLTVDLQKSGDYFGRYWIGTPLGDLTGILNVIERDVTQLTAAGGDIRVRAGESIVLRGDAVLDVSGGVLQHEGGFVQTTRLMDERRLFDMSDATPDRLYDNIYTGRSSAVSSKWSVAKTYALSLAPLGGGQRAPYFSGAPGGNLSLTAGSLALEGELLGRTVQGPAQLDNAERGSRLALNLLAEKRLDLNASTFSFIEHSPTPVAIRLQTGRSAVVGLPEFVLAPDGSPLPLPAALTTSMILGSSLFDEDESGFSGLSIDNREGSVTLAAPGDIVLRPSGSLEVKAANINVATGLRAAGGTVSLVANNYSPFLLQEQRFLDPDFSAKPAPTPLPGRGVVVVDAGARIDVSGQLVDHRRIGSATPFEYASLDAGDVKLQGYAVDLPRGSSLAASGGLKADVSGEVYAGYPGSISILAGRDPVLTTSIGGDLLLQADLAAYGAKEGGSLTIQANRVQIGGVVAPQGGLLLTPDFFQCGGFGQYNISGIGGRDAADNAIPALQVAPGTVIEPRALSLAPRLFPRLGAEEVLLPVGLRPAASLALEATGADDPFTLGKIESVALLTLGEGSRIRTDPRGSVALKGDVVIALGSIEAPAGRISVKGGSSFPVPSALAPAQTLAVPTVYLGPGARLDAAGAAVLLPDAYGRRAGILYHGGNITVEGNILAEAGAVLDVSGASAALDFHPSRLGLSTPYATAGLTTQPWGRQAVRRTVSSDGGHIEMTGSQMLYNDAALRGAAGGPDSLGGTLAVSSGWFSLGPRKSSDINLVVEQQGRASVFGNTAVYGNMASAARLLGTGPELAALFGGGSPNPGIGYFSLSQFSSGGFGSLDLGYDFRGGNFAFGGNVRFRGDARITAPGTVRVAGGGVIESDGQIVINARHVVLGREFDAPLAPGQRFQPFQQELAGGGVGDYFLPPLGGTGSLDVSARLIDTGTISLQRIGRASLAADGGDIRGNGTLNMAGNLTLRAAQIYPTTLAAFDIFAYDPAGGAGSVTINGSGGGSAPLSAGGSLRIFASNIRQNGTLRAPLGSIVLGWDGTDLDPATPALDRPQDAISGGGGTVARTVSLAAGSMTSVSAAGLTIPFGLSPDGLSWIDPRGVDVTLAGLPTRGVTLAGEEVRTASGSVVDLRGGGDLLAYRWIPGLGGSTDLLGAAGFEWGGGATYQAGQLVARNGRTYSARVGIDPRDFVTPPKPGEDGRYWTLVPESYAVVPGFGSLFAPYAPFNADATLLGGDPGFVAPSLRLGEQFVSAGGGGLSAGTYTLLPSRFALLPGAYLVRPVDGTLASSGLALSSVTPFGLPGELSSQARDDGISLVAGNTLNSLHASAAVAPVRRLFAVMAPDLVAQQASYELYTADSFMAAAAVRQNAQSLQRLPQDAAPMVLSGNASLSLAGTVRAAGSRSGRAADIDIASSSDIRLVGAAGISAPGVVNLNTDVLSAWGAGRLLVGGVRRTSGDGSTVVDVRTRSVTLDNPGRALRGSDIALVSREKIEMTDGSGLAAEGSGVGGSYQVVGDGAALRASSGKGASIVRQGAGGSIAPLLSIGSGASVSGPEVVLDSTYGMDVDDSAGLVADRLSLAAGQVSLVLSPQDTLAGTIVSPHLVLEGGLLARVQNAKSLSLASYRSIDVYGTGQFGRAEMEKLVLSAAGLRGYGRSGTGATLMARDLFIGNPSAAAMPELPVLGGDISLVAGRTVTLGANDFALRGFADASLVAPGGLIASGAGALTTSGGLRVMAPLITGADRADHRLAATGDLTLSSVAGSTAAIAPGLGARLTLTGRSVTAGTLIDLPGGSVSLRAAGGDVGVDGIIRVDDRSAVFHELRRFAGAGRIDLLSETGDVRLSAGSRLSANGATGGGDAGIILISAPRGEALFSGRLEAQAGGTDARAGSFVLDAGTVPSYGGLRDVLAAGGFTESQSLRFRSGSVLIDGATRVRDFSLAADGGDITVTGAIDASGATGGRISLATGGNLTLRDGSVLTVAANKFSNAGKGGHIALEAGSAINGLVDTAALLNLQTGSRIDLSVGEYVAGSYNDPNSSAFYGKFEGTLHLRAPRTSDDVRIAALGATINGGSSVVAEAFRVYQRSSGVMDTALRNQIHADNNAFFGTAGTAGARETAIRTRLLAGSSLDQALLVVAPGVEIANPAGDLVLGLANPTGATSAEAAREAFTAADWDLSGWRYGSRSVPGLLNLRAAGDVVFNNALSDGFTPVSATADRGWSRLWLATLTAINANLPVNTQSWSYQITAGADIAAAGRAAVLPGSQLAQGKGSVLVGEFYPAIMNPHTSGSAAGAGSAEGQTADSIRIVDSDSDIEQRGTRFEVVRTGTGEIAVSAAADIRLRNPFSAIYSAGSALPSSTRVFVDNDFVAPVVNLADFAHPSQGDLGALQQRYSARWGMAGGDIRLAAGDSIRRVAQMPDGTEVPDSSRQLPSNWLYRRGFVDPVTGEFSANGGVDGSATVLDAATSTAWWVDFSNFFQGLGALGGGDVSAEAGGDIVNIDAVVPTTARMAGRDPATGRNLRPTRPSSGSWVAGISVSVRAVTSAGAFIRSNAVAANSSPVARSIPTQRDRRRFTSSDPHPPTLRWWPARAPRFSTAFRGCQPRFLPAAPRSASLRAVTCSSALWSMPPCCRKA